MSKRSGSDATSPSFCPLRSPQPRPLDVPVCFRHSIGFSLSLFSSTTHGRLLPQPPRGGSTRFRGRWTRPWHRGSSSSRGGLQRRSGSRAYEPMGGLKKKRRRRKLLERKKYKKSTFPYALARSTPHCRHSHAGGRARLPIVLRQCWPVAPSSPPSNSPRTSTRLYWSTTRSLMLPLPFQRPLLQSLPVPLSPRILTFLEGRRLFAH